MPGRDLLAGSPVSEGDTPPTVKDQQDATVTSTSTTFEAGSSVCGVAFIAPTTGRVLVKWKGQLDNTTSGTLLSYRIGTGETVGGGTELVSPSDIRAITMVGVDQVAFGAEDLVEGLEPGDVYNVQLMHRTTSGGSATINRRWVIVAPAT